MGAVVCEVFWPSLHNYTPCPMIVKVPCMYVVVYM